MDNLTIEDRMRHEIDLRTQMLSAAFERAANYTNLIIVAGYAGTFTLWSFTKDYLPEKAAMLSAIMLSISLFTFCGWEVFKMIFHGRTFRRFSNVISTELPPEEFFAAIKEADCAIKRANMPLYASWYFVLCVAVPTGFGSALLLFYNFLANLTGWFPIGPT